MDIKIQPAIPEGFDTRECWDSHKEKLLCHMVLLDKYAKALSSTAGVAFWRAFIAEDRETGVVIAKFRWNYTTTGRQWYRIIPSVGTKDPANHLRRNLESVLVQAATALGVPESETLHMIECFYPPDDGGNPDNTIAWLVEKDLIEIQNGRDQC